MLGRTRIALLAGVFVIGIAGCGGDDGTIPQTDSEQLLGLLAQMKTQIETGDCTLAEGTATKIDDAINSLPNGVDPEVQDALSKGAQRLTELTNDPSQCVEGGATGAEGAQTTTTDTEATSTETTTTTSSTTTETAPPEEDTTEQPPTDTPPGHETPPGNGAGQGGGNQGNQGSESPGEASPSGGLEPPGGGKE
jgi:hypothetical protein